MMPPRPWRRVVAQTAAGLVLLGSSLSQRTTCAAAPAARHPSNARAVLWLHGLGDTGDGWRGHFRVEGAKFFHPTAPVRRVTCNGGMSMTSWFDIQRIPVDLDEPDSPTDLNVSVASVHEMLRELESQGFAADHIMLGGFSQGGTVSLLAGLSYAKTLGGIVSISGWCGSKGEHASWISEHGRRTPVLFCYGDGDPIVDFSLTERSAKILKRELGDTMKTLSPKRDMHQPSPQEDAAVKKFLSRASE